VYSVVYMLLLDMYR